MRRGLRDYLSKLFLKQVTLMVLLAIGPEGVSNVLSIDPTEQNQTKQGRDESCCCTGRYFAM